MRVKRKILAAVFLIIIALLSTACSIRTAPKPDAESTASIKTDVQQEQPKEQKQEQEQEPEENIDEASAAETAVEADKTVEVEQKSIEEPEKVNEDEGSSLLIEGSGADGQVVMTLEELKAMSEAYVEDDFFSLNSYGTKEYFHFRGVKLKAILDKAGLKDTAATVKFVASDGYEHEITAEQALREDYIDEQNPDKKYPVIIAWHENGKDYDAEKGAPFRLVMGQKEPGDVNKPQWVQNVSRIIIE